jgi:hypothetical protein
MDEAASARIIELPRLDQGDAPTCLEHADNQTPIHLYVNVPK